MSRRRYLAAPPMGQGRLTPLYSSREDRIRARNRAVRDLPAWCRLPFRNAAGEVVR